MGGLVYFETMYKEIYKKRNENKDFDEYFADWYKRNHNKRCKRRRIENPYAKVDVPDDLNILLNEGTIIKSKKR